MRTGGIAGRAVLVALMGVMALSSQAFAANPVEVENARPGNVGWDLATVSPGTLEGYSDRISANPATPSTSR